jgi:hypothetical protein
MKHQLNDGALEQGLGQEQEAACGRNDMQFASRAPAILESKHGWSRIGEPESRDSTMAM